MVLYYAHDCKTRPSCYYSYCTSAPTSHYLANMQISFKVREIYMHNEEGDGKEGREKEGNYIVL